MGWALQFDGVNDYLSFGTVTLDGDFSIDIYITLDVLGDSYHGITSSNNGSGNGTLRLNASGSLGFVSSTGTYYQFTLPGGALPSDGSLFGFRVARTGSTITVRDLILEQDSATVVTDSGSFAFDNFGRRYGRYLSGALVSLQVFDAGAEVFSLSPDDSDRSATGVPPTVKDTIGSNDATGINMPTDGSAWVDLGGGGGTLTLVPTGIASGESIGAALVLNSAHSIVPMSISSLEAIGITKVATTGVNVLPSGITSSGGVAIPAISLGAITLDMMGLSSLEHLGEPVILGGEMSQYIPGTNDKIMDVVSASWVHGVCVGGWIGVNT